MQKTKMSSSISFEDRSSRFNDARAFSTLFRNACNSDADSRDRVGNENNVETCISINFRLFSNRAVSAFHAISKLSAVTDKLAIALRALPVKLDTKKCMRLKAERSLFLIIKAVKRSRKLSHYSKFPENDGN